MNQASTPQSNTTKLYPFWTNPTSSALSLVGLNNSGMAATNYVKAVGSVPARCVSNNWGGASSLLKFFSSLLATTLCHWQSQNFIPGLGPCRPWKITSAIGGQVRWVKVSPDKTGCCPYLVINR